MKFDTASQISEKGTQPYKNDTVYCSLLFKFDLKKTKQLSGKKLLTESN